MESKNKYGLSRTIDSEAKRQIRQQCGFGCIVCGNSIYQYEHILPEFHEAKSHEVDKIGLLCGTCHDKVTRGIWPKEFIQEKRLNPFCINDYASKYEYYINPKSDIVIELGKIKFVNTNNIIVIDGNQILLILLPEENNSPPRINAQFFDRNGNKVAWINHNEWNGSSESFDIEAIGSRIKIRSNLYKVDLEMNLLHPNIFQIDTLNLNFNNKTIKGNKKKGYKIETKKASLTTGLEEISFNNKPFGISIQGDKIFIGSSKIINYTNLKGEQFQLDGHYEISGANVQVDYGDSSSPKLHIKTNDEGGGIGIKFNLPDSEQPKINLNFKKQERNNICNCGSSFKYKKCCLKNEQNLNLLVNNPNYFRITQNIFAIHKIKNINYRFEYSTNTKAAWVQWDKDSPIIVLNSSMSASVNDLSYSLLLWKLKKEGYQYKYDVYKDFREQIIRELQDLLISIPILETMKIEGLHVDRFFVDEVNFIKSTMHNKTMDVKDTIIGGTSIFEAIKALRFNHHTEYLTQEERKSILELFCKKSPLAYEISKKLDSIITDYNLFSNKGYNDCADRIFMFLNYISKGAFKEISNQ